MRLHKGGCTDTARESVLEVDSGIKKLKKSLAAPWTRISGSIAPGFSAGRSAHLVKSTWCITSTEAIRFIRIRPTLPTELPRPFVKMQREGRQPLLCAVLTRISRKKESLACWLSVFLQADYG